jgi:osmotically-inducible protein OsmY
MTNGANITVTTHDGVVMLSGTVRNQDTFDRARAAAARVRDVKSVDTNGLVIVGS